MASKICVLLSVASALLVSTEGKFTGQRVSNVDGQTVRLKHRGIIHPDDKDFYHLKVVDDFAIEAHSSKKSELSTPAWMTEYEYEGSTCGGTPVQQDSYMTNVCYAFANSAGATANATGFSYGSMKYICSDRKSFFTFLIFNKALKFCLLYSW